MKTTTRDEMTAAEMATTKHSDADSGFKRVGRSLYRWNARDEVWEILTAKTAKFWRTAFVDIAKRAADRAEDERLAEMARTMPWHEFVCTHVAAATAKEPVAGYTVRAVTDGWELCFMGSAQFPPMSASTLYSWFERLPLITASRAADEFRYAALTAKAA